MSKGNIYPSVATGFGNGDCEGKLASTCAFAGQVCFKWGMANNFAHVGTTVTNETLLLRQDACS